MTYLGHTAIRLSSSQDLNSALNITIIILIYIFFSIYHTLQSCTCDIVMPHLVGVLVTTSLYSKERQQLETLLLLDLSQHGLARDRCWSCPPSPHAMPHPLPYLFIYLSARADVCHCGDPYCISSAALQVGSA